MTGTSVSQWAKVTLSNVTKCPPIDLEKVGGVGAAPKYDCSTLDGAVAMRINKPKSCTGDKKNNKKLEERFTMEMLKYCFI